MNFEQHECTTIQRALETAADRYRVIAREEPNERVKEQFFTQARNCEALIARIEWEGFGS